jgi:hypothetical protein
MLREADPTAVRACGERATGAEDVGAEEEGDVEDDVPAGDGVVAQPTTASEEISKRTRERRIEDSLKRRVEQKKRPRVLAGAFSLRLAQNQFTEG